ncbi:hypothetical protein HHK36_009784 [Tetracentron sinense]|uniref:Interferon-related developmental regulator N-terminal domain-containing protein n=1 Tax=Tetracentron sinense TaxID=13715 RepID=A0A834ZBI0_TETSI|nr:hypothetical protein HHK36_009784 [Tetracentron sinense]
MESILLLQQLELRGENQRSGPPFDLIKSFDHSRKSLMLSRTAKRRTEVLFDSDDDNSVRSTWTAMSDLALVPEMLVYCRSATLLYHCLNSIKRGSSKEISLACHAIGLLALTVGCGDNVHEILEDSIPPFSKALKSGLESSNILSILDCLAIITFVGGKNPEEMERSMHVVWQLLHPKLGSNVVASKPSSAVIASAISAWSFLLSTMNGWRPNSKYWRESISYFSSLLEEEDRSVRNAAGEALALIFELGSLEKFYYEAVCSSHSSDQEGNNCPERYAHVQGLKEKILNQVRNLSVEAGGKGSAKRDLSSQPNLFRDVLEFLKDGYCPKASIKIGEDSLNISTWSQLLQVISLLLFFFFVL